MQPCAKITATKKACSMQCPYRNPVKDSGCDLVDDPSGISGTMAREFCDFRQCQECPLFQEALQENLHEGSRLVDEEKIVRLKDAGVEKHPSPVPGVWELAGGGGRRGG